MATIDHSTDLDRLDFTTSRKVSTFRYEAASFMVGFMVEIELKLGLEAKGNSKQVNFSIKEHQLGFDWRVKKFLMLEMNY